MKTYIKLMVIALIFTACNKDDDKPSNPIDQLPPATQTGAGTFGCLVNGVPYVDNSGFFNCFYQLVNGEYYFGIQVEQRVSNIVLMGLGSNASNIVVNTTIQLDKDETQNFYAGVNLANLGGTIKTTDLPDGNIQFTKLDFVNKIISAKFEFTVIDPHTNIIYNITEGRFDSHFTQ